MNLRRFLAITMAMVAATFCGCTTVYRYPRPGDLQQTVVRVENANAAVLSSATQGSQNARGPSQLTAPIQAPQELIGEIVLAYRRDAYDTVIRLTQEVLSYPSVGRNERAKALVYAGAMCFIHQDNTGAQRYFQQAVRENPETMPDEKIRTTAMLEFFLRVRRETLGS